MTEKNMKKLSTTLLIFSSINAFAGNELLEIPEVLTQEVKVQPLDVEAAQDLIIQVTHLVVNVDCLDLNIDQARMYENILMNKMRTMETKTDADIRNKRALIFVNGKLIRKILEAGSCQRAAELSNRTLERLKK